MFGYLKPQLKNAPHEIFNQYRSVYCGLCHCLRKKYGLTGVACLNYEIVFMLLLISSVDKKPKRIFHGSCTITPFLFVPYIDYLSPDVNTAAAMAVLTSNYMIKDNLADNGSFFWKFADWAVRGRTSEIIEEYYFFSKKIQKSISTFYSMESNSDTLLPQITMACGNITESIIEPLLMYVDSPVAETISQIANKIGQWIYLLDACDDYGKDKKKNNYNPLNNLEKCETVSRLVMPLEESIIKLVSLLPMTQYEELVSYIVNETLPHTSTMILKKFEDETKQ